MVVVLAIVVVVSSSSGGGAQTARERLAGGVNQYSNFKCSHYCLLVNIENIN